MHTYVLEIIVDFLELFLFFIGTYYVVCGVFSFVKRNDVLRQDFRTNRFAVIIPAHNEGAVLGQLLSSISASRYPKNKYYVFVVADDCSDNTAAVARSYGARVLVKRTGNNNKSSAVSYAVEHIKSLREEYDCIAVFDADNTVHMDCIMRMNEMLNCGYSAVQGYVDSKNPNENWLTAAYSVWHTLESRLAKMSCHNLGIGCKISGTGYAVRFDVVKRCMPSDDCLAEDLEYTVRLRLMGIKVAFAKKAVVYDEKPAEFGKSVKQRIRWAQGVVDVQGRYGGLLLKKGKIIDWLSLYGDFLGQFCYGVFLVISIFSTISILFGYQFVLCSLWVRPVCYVALNLYLGIGALSAFAGLILENKLSRKTIFNLFGFLLYIVSWIPIGIVGIFKHNKKEWYHTEHTGSVQ